MGMLTKLNEALDQLLEGIDQALSEDPDFVLTEEQMDDEMSESIGDYLRDFKAMYEKWSPEMKARFNESVEAMLEESEPELMTEKNIVRLDRNTVFNQLVGLFCLVIARRRKDPVFATYRKASLLRRKAKNTLRKKYSSRAIPIARKALKRRHIKS